MQRTANDGSLEYPTQCLLPHHVKRALAYMRGNVAEKIALVGLASACAHPNARGTMISVGT